MKFLSFFGGLFGGKKQTKALPPISDTARSVSQGRVIEVLCSGGNYGIEGLLTADIRESIFLDDTPIRRQGIDFFTGVNILEKRGTPFQTTLDGFGNELVSENSVGAEVRYGLPLTRSFVNDAVTAIKIRVGVTISKNKLSGGQVVQVIGDAINFNVYIKEGSGAFVLRGSIQISGKFTDIFEKEYYFTVNPTRLESNFNIRLERTTIADTENEKRVLAWQSYSEVIEDILPFKRIALVGISFDTEQFGGSFPERRYHLGGQYLEIPTNATIGTDRGLDYSGNWNGLFYISYTRACADVFAIIWYLLLDEIDGLGIELNASMIDRYSLYEISKYNNEFVPDGKGGTERRYLFNMVINKEQDGFKVIDSILSGCGARRYWEGGLLKFTQDRQETIFCIVTNADVDGYFTYSSTDIDERATAVNVTWVDLENFGKTRTKYIADPTLIAKYGYNLKDLEAVGCTRESQATRFGLSVIYSENYEPTTITFKGRQYLGLIPIGKVIAIANYFESGERLGGLVSAQPSTTTITIDYPITIKEVTGFDETFYLMFYADVTQAIRTGVVTNAYEHYLTYGISENRYPNGYLIIVQTATGVVQRRIQNLAGSYTTFTLNEAIPVLPQNTNWILFTPEYKHKLFRVVSKEPDDKDLDSISLTCTEYSEFKWEKIERNFEVAGSTPSVITPAVIPPTNIKVSTVIFNGQITIEVSWIDSDSTNSSYICGYQYSGTWYDTPTLTNNLSFENMLAGEYLFRVASVSYSGLISDYVVTNVIFISLAQAVADLSNSSYSVFNGIN
jgi:predicted phage tail protein